MQKISLRGARIFVHEETALVYIVWLRLKGPDSDQMSPQMVFGEPEVDLGCLIFGSLRVTILTAALTVILEDLVAEVLRASGSNCSTQDYAAAGCSDCEGRYSCCFCLEARTSE